MSAPGHHAHSLLFALLSGVCAIQLLTAPAAAQTIGDDVGWVNRDYFLHYHDPETKKLLDNVERNHFGPANFWKWYRAGDFYYARKELDYVLWVFPNHPRALQLLGSIAKLTNTRSAPIAYYQKALRLHPRRGLTHAQFGEYLAEIGEPDQAIVHLKEAIRLDPELALAHVWLAKVYHQIGQKELASSAAAQARALGYKERILEDR